MMSHGVDPRLSDYRYLKWSHRRNSSEPSELFLKPMRKDTGKDLLQDVRF